MPDVGTQTQQPEGLPIAIPMETQTPPRASLFVKTNGLWEGNYKTRIICRLETTEHEEGKELDAALLKRWWKVAEEENARGIKKHGNNASINTFNDIWKTTMDKYGKLEYVGTLHTTDVQKCDMLQWLEELGWKVEYHVPLVDFTTELIIKKV